MKPLKTLVFVIPFSVFAQPNGAGMSNLNNDQAVQFRGNVQNIIPDNNVANLNNNIQLLNQLPQSVNVNFVNVSRSNIGGPNNIISRRNYVAVNRVSQPQQRSASNNSRATNGTPVVQRANLSYRPNQSRPRSNQAVVQRTNLPYRPSQAVARNVNPHPQVQQAVVVAHTNVSNPVVNDPPKVNANDNYGENNVGNLFVSNDNRNYTQGIYDNEIPQQSVAVVSQQQKQSSSNINKSNDSGGLSLPKLNLPKLNSGGKTKSSSASSSHIKRHVVKKFFIKQARKYAAKHSGGRKKFSLDGCFSWLTGK